MKSSLDIAPFPKEPQHLPIVLGHYVNALGIIRSLGAVGLPTICTSARRGIAGWSRYTHYYHSPSPTYQPEAAIAHLVEIGKQLPAQGVLFATKDSWLALVSQHWSDLSTYYLRTMSSWDIISRALDKRAMYEVAEKSDIPIPSTIWLREGIDTWQAFASAITFPCMIKPVVTIGFQKQLRSSGRVLQADCPDALEAWSQRMKTVGLGRVPIVLQAQVEGPTENLYTVTAYSDMQGDIKGYSIGHKIHQYPAKAGTITSGHVYDEPRVYRLAARLIKALGYRGISNTEFKFDESEGCFKLMEINCRPGKWNSAAYFAGVNLPYMAYRDTIQPGCLDQETIVGQDELMWIHLNGEILAYMAQILDTKEPLLDRLSVRSWGKKLQGPKVFAVESLADPLPMLMEWPHLAARLLNRKAR